MARHVWRDEQRRGLKKNPPRGNIYGEHLPLPYVNPNAYDRVKDKVAIPKECRYCLCDVELVNNSTVYGKEYGKWPFVYLCTGCGARVSLHPETDLPMGYLANHDDREARRRSKPLFQNMTDRFFEGNRNKSYKWLAEKMGIPKSECHFSMFDEDRCWRAYRIMYEVFFEGSTNIVA